MNFSDKKINTSKVSHATKALEDILIKMGNKGKVVKEENGINEVTLTINSDEGELLIGKRGETLDAIEYILTIIVNNDPEDRLFICVDTENYRNKRRETLEHMAEKAMLEVRDTGKTYEIRHLNAKERKIIHMVVQAEKDIETLSCGEGYDRTLLIKKR